MEGQVQDCFRDQQSWSDSECPVSSLAPGRDRSTVQVDHHIAVIFFLVLPGISSLVSLALPEPLFQDELSLLHLAPKSMTMKQALHLCFMELQSHSPQLSGPDTSKNRHNILFHNIHIKIVPTLLLHSIVRINLEIHHFVVEEHPG